MKNLKKLRKQHNLSQQKLADILHISQQSIYKYENDITFPDIEILIQMANYFSTSIDYLVGYTDIPHKRPGFLPECSQSRWNGIWISHHLW